MQRARHRLLPMLIVAAVLTFGACGEVGDRAADGGGAPTAAAPGEVQLTVLLDEWSITPGASTIAAGELLIVAVNDGSAPHELVVYRTGLAADALPTTSGIVDETTVEVVFRIDQFVGGMTIDGAATLEPGEYALVCNVPGHYQLGMYASLTVR